MIDMITPHANHIPEISQLLTAWQLSDPELLTETNTSFVYKAKLKEEVVVLKVLKPLGIIDEKYGANALLYFNGHGAVRVLAHNEQAVLLEYANGPSLDTLVKQGQDVQSTQIIADILTQLHSQTSSLPSSSFVPLTTWFHSLFLHARASSDPFFTQAAIIAEKLLAHPQNLRVLHGDIHHENILNSPRGWLAIDPKGLYGESTYDAANALLNPHTMEELVVNKARLLASTEIFGHALNVDRQRLLQFTFAYCALSAAWSLEDNQNPALALNVGTLLKPYVT